MSYTPNPSAELDNGGNTAPTQPSPPAVAPEVAPVLPNTAVIRINPGFDEAVIALATEAERLLEWAKARTVACSDDALAGGNDLVIIISDEKKVEDKRNEWLAPIRIHTNDINVAFKLISGPLEEAEKLLNQKLTAYRQKLRYEAAAIEKANALRREAAELEASTHHGEISEPVVVNPVPPVMPKTVRTDVGSLTAREDWDYEITDASQLPREYLKPDLVKIRHDVVTNKGKLVIPGIRQYQKESFRTTPRKVY
jgi:hypothetical protein